VIKLARKFDPAGLRTLGVVTKCDDAAQAEASDIVEKVLMTRDSDVRLALGFHCVVNRSQKNIDEGMSRTDLWQKEVKVFSDSERLRTLPPENWGTSRLMEKIASVQEARVDECLPKIKESVRAKMLQLRQELRNLPPQAETEADQFRLFNGILVKINADLEQRVRAEYISTEACDRDLAIAPKVALMVQTFRQKLFAANPEWLGQDMIDEVTDTVETFVHGYTVDNLTGPQVFINLVKRIFVEDGLLQGEVADLIDRVAKHLGKVVYHLIEQHADLNNVVAARLALKADDVIDRLTSKATGFCDALARAQAVTSTTHGAYMVKLTQFRKSWVQEGAQRLQEILMHVLSPGGYGEGPSDASEKGALTPEFVAMVKAAPAEPQKLAILEICASLHVYTGNMIEGFVEMAAKLVKFYMVEELGNELQESWRMDLGGSKLHELFPKDVRLVQRRDHIKQMTDGLAEFMEQLSTLRIACIATPKNVRRTYAQRAAEKVSTQDEAKKAEMDQQRSHGCRRARATAQGQKELGEAEDEENEDEEEKRQRKEAEMKKERAKEVEPTSETTAPKAAAKSPAAAKAARADKADKATKETLPIALIFPGEGGEYVNMLDGVKDNAEVKEMLSQAKEILGYDLLDMCLKGPADKLAEIKYCQPAMFVGGLAGICKLKFQNKAAAEQPRCMAGLSVGEYTALCAAGVLSFEDGLRLVKLRGEAMQEAAQVGKQAMLSVAGLEQQVLEQCCADAEKQEPGSVCRIAFVLAPKFFCCAGTENAVSKLKTLADSKGALQARMESGSAYNTSLMQPAQGKLEKALQEAFPKMKPPSCDVYMNVTGQPLPAGTDPKVILRLLQKQLTSPVLWNPIIEKMIQDGVTEVYECGPLSQLKGLMQQINAQMWSKTFSMEI
ncbi:unnamed protein product, partial [Effrenium voratum]